MSKLITFHKILPGCEEGNVEAWRAFLMDYTPMALCVFGIYSPWGAGECWNQWRDALPALGADGCAKLRGFSHQSEREFLVDLRGFLQERVAARLAPSHGITDSSAPTVETLGALLRGLPLLHQEIAFLTLAGYSQGTLANVLRITPTVAVEGLDRLRTNYAEVLERSEDRCLWPAAWIGVCQAARANTPKDCTPLRQFIRILDGQASWYDKSPAEEHRSNCLHCLELWTSLREVVAWDRARQPLQADKIEPLLAAVPVKRGVRKPSLFARIRGK